MTQHYMMTGAERQIKLGSTGHFADAPLCGSGDGHAVMTRSPEACDCGPCNDVLATEPAYLELNRETAWEISGHIYPREEADGPEPVYWIWTDGEIYQITNTEREPSTAAGYPNLESLLKLKNIEPQRVIEAEKPGNGPRI